MMPAGRSIGRARKAPLHDGGTRDKRSGMGFHAIPTAGDRPGRLGLLLGVVAAPALRGDEPTRLGRLFRLGGRRAPATHRAVGKPSSDASYGRPLAHHVGTSVPRSSLPVVLADGVRRPTDRRRGQRRRTTRDRASAPDDEAGDRVRPAGHAGLDRPVDDGKPFCMFIEVFADGTVLDSEGVHRVGAGQPPADRPGASSRASWLSSRVTAAVRRRISSSRCRSSTYDRYRGRLRATPFAFSGNPQGCDPAVKQLNDAIDAIQTKLAGPPVSAPTGSTGAATQPSPVPALGQPARPLPPTARRIEAASACHADS